MDSWGHRNRVLVGGPDPPREKAFIRVMLRRDLLAVDILNLS